MGKSWFSTGDEVLERAQQYQAELESSINAPKRFFLKPGKSAKVTFLDSAGFGFLEHRLSIDGNWNNFFTCLRDFSECPLCDSGDRPSYVVAWTIIDHSVFVSEKTGKEYKNQKKLLVAKRSVVSKLFRRKESLENDLTMGLLSFHRDGYKESACGEDIEVIRKLTKEELLKFKPPEVDEKAWRTPYDYMELFKPQSVDELRRIVGEAPPVGSFSLSDKSDDDTLDSIF